MLISAAMPSTATTTFGQPRAGGDATTNVKTEKPVLITQSISADQMAEELRGQVVTLQSNVSSINQINVILGSGIRPPNISDDTYAGYLKDLAGMRDGLVESVKDRGQMLAANFSVSGELPDKQLDGKWSPGSFTVSASIKGTGIRSDTYGNMTMARKGESYVSWSDSEYSASVASSASNVALQVMRKMNSLNLKV